MLLTIPAAAQVSSGTLQGQRIDAIDTYVQSLQSGRPTITGQPTYQNGFSAGASTFTGAILFNSSATFSGPATFSGLLRQNVAFTSTTVTQTVVSAPDIAVNGSTFTLTTHAGGRVKLSFYAHGFAGSSGGQVLTIKCMRDGVLITGCGLKWYSQGASDQSPISFVFLESPSEAVHNYTLMANTAGASFDIQNATETMYFEGVEQ